jgi:hypothetical protein
VPAPPGGVVRVATPARGGRHVLYETELPGTDVWDFYLQEMPARGWTRDHDFEAARTLGAPSEPVLAFLSDKARSIIAVQEQAPRRTFVTVLVMGRAGRASGAAGGGAGAR